MATMREVALRAGVSVKTVSRVFNDDPHVLPDTRRRVQEALAGLNYTPNSLARTFRDGRAPVVGVAVPSISDPFFAAIAGGVEEVASRHDMSVVVTSLGEDGDRERELVESLLQRQVGALVMTPVAADQSYLARWAARTPVVVVDRPARGVDVDCFVEDDLGGARAATAHLLARGHRRVAFAGDRESVPTTANRLAGYRAALEEAGLEVDPRLVQLGASDPDGAAAAARRLAALDPAPTALFSSDARTTMVLVPALASRRMAVTGFGDFPMASMLSPALTVVDQDPAALGRRAAERAMRRLDGSVEGAGEHVVLPVRLLERSSCRPPDRLLELFPWTVPAGAERVVWSSAPSGAPTAPARG
ncbi:LacI family transcriptional regulator [Pseudokineococcus lusitanus]|uniref:LacI family transcriptional regulator n=2 Tax=Pseudokineococcus lusitanus TaxID=763993 RepID=A0A3N1HQG4_9ACTN|nr:LacI family transcriptional regulator [Pseudokineococcus lusitanus]